MPRVSVSFLDGAVWHAGRVPRYIDVFAAEQWLRLTVRRLAREPSVGLLNIREIRFTLPNITTCLLPSIVTFVDLRLWRRSVNNLQQASPVILLLGV